MDVAFPAIQGLVVESSLGNEHPVRRKGIVKADRDHIPSQIDIHVLGAVVFTDIDRYALRNITAECTVAEEFIGLWKDQGDGGEKAQDGKTEREDAGDCPS